MILLTIILVALLFGNWLINETWLFIPIDLFSRLTSFGWWGLALLTVLFFAWCMAEE